MYIFMLKLCKLTDMFTVYNQKQIYYQECLTIHFTIFCIPVVFNLFSARTPRDTSPLNFLPPKLLVQDFILE
jgi:hypothetical protein